MLVTAVIIMLREVLEAALLIGVLLALGSLLQPERRWTNQSIGIGLLGAIVYAAGTATVSDWFDGVGQEILNASMQIVIYGCLAAIALLISRRGRNERNNKFIVALMMTSIAIAITREGSEILIYLSGFVAGGHLPRAVLLGSLVGAGIGASVGALAYFALLGINRKWLPHTGIAVVILIGAGMAGQATLLLIQADWLPSRAPLWDTSGLIPENSITGQLLYALIGYEATPTPIQAAVYFGGLLLPFFLMLLIRRRGYDANT